MVETWVQTHFHTLISDSYPPIPSYQTPILLWSGQRWQDISECCCILDKHSTCYHHWKKIPICVPASKCDLVLTGLSPALVKDLQTVVVPPRSCFLFFLGTLFVCSHNIACLDICGSQIEMKVVIVKKWLIPFFLNWEGGDTTGCASKTFMHANKQNLRHSWKPVVICSHG